MFGAFQMDCIPVAAGPHTAGTSVCSTNMVGLAAPSPRIADVMVTPAEQDACQELQHTPLPYWVF